MLYDPPLFRFGKHVFQGRKIAINCGVRNRGFLNAASILFSTDRVLFDLVHRDRSAQRVGAEVVQPLFGESSDQLDGSSAKTRLTYFIFR
jgi:hypothetical protein